MTKYEAWQIASPVTAYYFVLLLFWLVFHRSIRPLWGSLIVAPLLLGVAVWLIRQVGRRE